MKKLFLIFSHKLTNEQIDDAKNSLKIQKFEYYNTPDKRTDIKFEYNSF
jgi:hypothetical protein